MKQVIAGSPIAYSSATDSKIDQSAIVGCAVGEFEGDAEGAAVVGVAEGTSVGAGVSGAPPMDGGTSVNFKERTW